jgi:hypothetical protein
MPCPESDCRIPRRSGMESPVCCSDAQRLACASKTSQQLVSKSGALYNGQLFTFSLLAASLVCSSPALAERAANPADLEAYNVASYREAPIRIAYSPRANLSRVLPALPVQLRGNACLQSALGVERLPVSSRSMQDILDQCGLLGDDMQSGASPQPVGKDAFVLPVLVAAAVVHSEQQVHANNCTSCHSGY